MVISNTFFVGHRYTDKTYYIKNSSILTMFEDIAGMHSNAAGEDYHTSPSRWLLTSYKLKIHQKPKYGDEINISTWSVDIRNITATREFEVRNSVGKLIICGLSNWAHYNIEDKKFDRVPETLIDAYESESQKTNFADDKIKKLAEPTDYIYEKECEIYPHWIDVNNHLNNAHYLDLASEFLSGRVNTEENVEEIEIMYKHEILPGDKIKCMLSETEETYTVVCKNAVSSQLHAIIIFHKKAKKPFTN